VSSIRNSLRPQARHRPGAGARSIVGCAGIGTDCCCSQAAAAGPLKPVRRRALAIAIRRAVATSWSFVTVGGHNPHRFDEVQRGASAFLRIEHRIGAGPAAALHPDLLWRSSSDRQNGVWATCAVTVPQSLSRIEKRLPCCCHLGSRRTQARWCAPDAGWHDAGHPSRDAAVYRSQVAFFGASSAHDPRQRERRQLLPGRLRCDRLQAALAHEERLVHRDRHSGPRRRRQAACLAGCTLPAATMPPRRRRGPEVGGRVGWTSRSSVATRSLKRSQRSSPRQQLAPFTLAPDHAGGSADRECHLVIENRSSIAGRCDQASMPAPHLETHHRACDSFAHPRWHNTQPLFDPAERWPTVTAQVAPDAILLSEGRTPEGIRMNARAAPTAPIRCSIRKTRWSGWTFGRTPMRVVAAYGANDQEVATAVVGIGDASARRRTGFKGPAAAAWLQQQFRADTGKPNQVTALPAPGFSCGAPGRSEIPDRGQRRRANCARLEGSRFRPRAIPCCVRMRSWCWLGRRRRRVACCKPGSIELSRRSMRPPARSWLTTRSGSRHGRGRAARGSAPHPDLVRRHLWRLPVDDLVRGGSPTWAAGRSAWRRWNRAEPAIGNDWTRILFFDGTEAVQHRADRAAAQALPPNSSPGSAACGARGAPGRGPSIDRHAGRGQVAGGDEFARSRGRVDHRDRPREQHATFKYQYLQTQDPNERYDKVLEFLQGPYFQEPAASATCLIGAVRAGLGARGAAARPRALRARVRAVPPGLPDSVRRHAAAPRAPAPPGRPAGTTGWFNEQLPPGVEVLAFAPDWAHAARYRERMMSQVRGFTSGIDRTMRPFGALRPPCVAVLEVRGLHPDRS